MKVVLIGALAVAEIAVAVAFDLAYGERVCREINAFLDNYWQCFVFAVWSGATFSPMHAEGTGRATKGCPVKAGIGL